MSDLQKFRVYPRGFLGIDIARHFERTPKPFTVEFSNHQYRATGGMQDGNEIPVNPHVENIYSTYLKNEINVSSLEFREKVLSVAFDAFGVSRFDVWMLAQFKNPAAGDFHRRFLEDTIKFIQTGKRDIPLETWGALIQITDEGNHIGSMPESIREFFDLGAQPNNQNKWNLSVVDIVTDWCSHDGGFEDLIGTLHIFFGNV